LSGSCPDKARGTADSLSGHLVVPVSCCQAPLNTSGGLMSVVSVTVLLLVTARIALMFVQQTAQVLMIWLVLRGTNPGHRAPILAALRQGPNAARESPPHRT
jgi:hypothetical protein